MKRPRPVPLIVCLIVCLVVVASAGAAHAGRPLITDDAGVVGRGGIQIETWARFDHLSLEHWMLIGVGAVAPLELSAGLVHGLDHEHDAYSLAAPLLQVKLLLREPSGEGLPGVAVAAAVVAPTGHGPFRSPGWEYFVYAAGTSGLVEGNLLIHGNLGLFGTEAQYDEPTVTWGAAVQLALGGPWHGAAELFSGDPFLGGRQGAGHLCLRFYVAEALQLDATAGRGLWGDQQLATWGTLGLRVVGGPFW